MQSAKRDTCSKDDGGRIGLDTDQAIVHTDTHQTKSSINEDTSLVMTQVGFVNIASISDDGLKVS